MSSTASKVLGGGVAILLLLTGCSSTTDNAPEPGTSAEQACAQPQVIVSRSTVEPGSTVTIEGADWSACADTPNDPTPSPWTSVDLSFSQGGEQQFVGTAPIQGGLFAATVALPADALPGEASIHVTSSGYSTTRTIEISNR